MNVIFESMLRDFIIRDSLVAFFNYFIFYVVCQKFLRPLEKKQNNPKVENHGYKN